MERGRWSQNQHVDSFILLTLHSPRPGYIFILVSVCIDSWAPWRFDGDDCHPRRRWHTWAGVPVRFAHLSTWDNFWCFTFRRVVKQRNPVVVIDGSGGTADVIAYAYNFVHNPLYVWLWSIRVPFWLFCPYYALMFTLYLSPGPSTRHTQTLSLIAWSLQTFARSV